MKKNYIFSFIFGIIIYFVLHSLFDINKIFEITITLLLGCGVLIFLKINKYKIMLANLNEFVDITNQSVEKIIADDMHINKSIHNIKNELYYVKDMLEKKEYNDAQEKIDNVLLECYKIYSPSICANIYIDSFFD